MLDFNVLCSILAGVCMLTQHEVDYCDVGYLHHRWVGTTYKFQIEERSRLEVARYQSLFAFNAKFASKPIKRPVDLGKFPWEIEKPKLTPNKIERLKGYGHNSKSGHDSSVK
jgi:hypothetical protein